MSRGKSLAYKPGAGASRDYWAIKKWLHENGFTLTDIAGALGINAGIVSATIRGVRNTRQVLKLLADKGCPVKILSLPDDMNDSDNYPKG
jgi:hypothetical protein